MAKKIEFEVDVTDGEVDELNDKLDQTAKKLDNVEKEAKSADSGLKKVGENGGAMAILDELTGGLASKIRDAAEATKLFNGQLKGTRAALIATGIGALVVAVGLLITYWDDITEAVTGVNQELEEQLDIQREIVDEMERELGLLESSENILRLQGKSEAEILQMKKDRIMLVISEQSENLRLAKIQLENLQAAEKRAYDFFNTVTTLATVAFRQILQFLDRIPGFNLDETFEEGRGWVYEKLFGSKEGIEQRKQEIQDLEEAILSSMDRVAAITLQQREMQGQETGQVDAVSVLTGMPMKEMEGLAFREIDLVREIQEAKTHIELEESERRKRAALAELEYKESLIHAEANVLEEFSVFLRQIGEENKAAAIVSIIAEQVASVARTISSLGVANAKAVAASPLTAGQPWVTINTISAGLSIANSVMAAQKAISELGGGGGVDTGTGTALGDTAAAGASSQAPDINLIGNSQGNQVADALANTRPQKAYVVSREMTTQQELDRNIQAEAEL